MKQCSKPRGFLRVSALVPWPGAARDEAIPLVSHAGDSVRIGALREHREPLLL